MTEGLDAILQTTTTQTVVAPCGLCDRTVPVTMRFTWQRTENTCRATPIPANEQTHHCPGSQP